MSYVTGASIGLSLGACVLCGAERYLRAGACIRCARKVQGEKLGTDAQGRAVHRLWDGAAMGRTWLYREPRGAS